LRVGFCRWLSRSRTIIEFWASTGARTRRPSSPRTGSWPASTTPTSTRGRTLVSRRSPRPTRSSPIPRSAGATTRSVPTGSGTPSRARRPGRVPEASTSSSATPGTSQSSFGRSPATLPEPAGAAGGNGGGKPCATCHGTGWQRARREVDVRIPAGVRTGQKVRVSGEGGGGTGGRGDLYLVVSVAPDTQFERKGDDVHVTLPITAPEAALGATIEVPTLRGKVSMKIPPAT